MRTRRGCRRSDIEDHEPFSWDYRDIMLRDWCDFLIVFIWAFFGRESALDTSTANHRGTHPWQLQYKRRGDRRGGQCARLQQLGLAGSQLISAYAGVTIQGLWRHFILIFSYCSLLAHKANVAVFCTWPICTLSTSAIFLHRGVWMNVSWSFQVDESLCSLIISALPFVNYSWAGI